MPDPFNRSPPHLLPPKESVEFKWTTRLVTHVTLTIIKAGDHYLFAALPKKVNLAADTSIEKYAKEVEAANTACAEQPTPEERLKAFEALTARAVPPTPFDIEVKEQCYVLLELDCKINWDFSPKGVGVSTEKPWGSEIYGDNFGAVYVQNGGLLAAADGKVVPNDCRVLYFGVARRRAFELQHKFNFHIDFWQEGVGSLALKRLPLIFDPDVGNNGGAIFP